MSLKLKILNLMHTYGVNEVQLAAQINLDRTTLNKILNGKTLNPRIQTISAVAKYFKIDINELLNEFSELTTPSQNIAQILKQLIILQGSPSLSKLASEIGISKSILSKILNNKIHNPHPETLGQIANYFNITIGELTGYASLNMPSINITKTVTLSVMALNQVNEYLTNDIKNLKQFNLTLDTNFSKGFIVQITNNDFTPQFIPPCYIVVEKALPKGDNGYILAKICQDIKIFTYTKLDTKLSLKNKTCEHILGHEEFEKVFVGTIIQTILDDLK